MPVESLYLLVLFAAVLHAIWNAYLKSAGDRLLSMAAMRFVSMCIGLAMLPFVPWPSSEGWLWLLCAAATHFFYYGLLIRSYQHGDMSQVYPIARGTAPILLAVVAFFAIGEALSVAQAAAVALTSTGLFALAFGAGGSTHAVRYALGTGVAITAYSFFGGLGVRVSPSVFGFLAWLEVVASFGFLAYAIPRRRGAVLAFVRSGGLTRGMAAGVLSFVGYGIYLIAVRVLPLAPVSALRETSVIFGAIIGALVFREGFGWRRVLAALLVAAGIATLAFSM